MPDPKLQAALKAVLLFHSGSPWTFEKKQEWQAICHELLGGFPAMLYEALTGELIESESPPKPTL